LGFTCHIACIDVRDVGSAVCLDQREELFGRAR
jgi:hypothetical protein